MMTTFDFLALGLIAVCIVLSAVRGLVWEIWNFVGYLLSVAAGRLLAVPTADLVFVSMQPRPLAIACAFVLVFVLTRIPQHFLHFVFDKVVKTAKLTTITRLLGAILGGIKGVLIVTVIVLACSFSKLPDDPEWRDAATSPFFEELAALGIPYLPDFLADQAHLPSRTQGAADESSSLPLSTPSQTE